MSKISNVILMLRYLQNGRKYTVKELSEKLEVTPRMIRSYKEELDKAGIYIDTIMGPYGGYVLKQNVKLPIDSYKSNVSEIDNNVYNILSRAIKEKRKVLINYKSLKDGDFDRIIRPYDLFLYETGWGCAAFCEYRNDLRHFDLKRINSIKLLDEYFK